MYMNMKTSIFYKKKKQKNWKLEKNLKEKMFGLWKV